MKIKSLLFDQHWFKRLNDLPLLTKLFTILGTIAFIFLGFIVFIEFRVPQDSFTRVLFITLLTFITLIIIIYLIHRFVIYPLLLLNQAIEQIVQGRSEISILPKKQGDEIGQLATNITKLLKQLKQMSEMMEQQMEAHATELSTLNNQLEYRLEKAKQAVITAQNAQTVAEQTSQVKTEFLANMSHEIRTTLNGVIGMSQLMQETNLSLEQRDFMTTIQTSGDALLDLINDILDFSKIDAGKLELEQRAFSIRTIIEDALDVWAAKAVEKQVALSYRLAPDTPDYFIGDGNRLRQILLNLLSNAIKFTESGEIVVAATSRLLDGQQYELGFAVTDSGPGIAPERLGRLFKPFSQEDASVARRYGGTGLGLAICKRLCELMGGTIGVDSEVGQGSTFSFTIQVSLHHRRPDVALRQTQPRFMGKHVLIVETHHTTRDVLVEYIQFWGMQAHVVSSNQELMNQLRKGVIFDFGIIGEQVPLNMVEQTLIYGVTVVEKVRQHRNKQQLPLLMLVSIGKQRKLLSGVKNYLNGVLYKPFKPSQLYDRLIDILDGRDWTGSDNAQTTQSMPQRIGNSTLKILLADDSPVNRKVAEHLLAQMGYTIDMVVDGLEVIEAIQQKQYDVILMDIKMPNLDGVETTHRIREMLTENKQPRIVAMTADAISGGRERYLALGMDDYISKPVRTEELAQVLNINLGYRATMTKKLRDTEEYAINKPLIDLTTLWSMIGEDETEIMASFIGSYLESSAERLVSMEKALTNNDAYMLELEAHTLKSSSRNFGATELATLCETLEKIAHQNQLDKASEILHAIMQQYSQVATELQQTQQELEANYNL